MSHRNPPSVRREKAQVWILSRSETDEWRVLILKTLPERGAFWQPVTGSIEAGEPIHKGALREAIEETGLSPLKNIESLGFDFTYEGKWGPSHETVYFYETYPGCPKVTLDATEHQGYQWVPMNEAVALLHYEPNRQALLQLIRQMTTTRLKKREKTNS